MSHRADAGNLNSFQWAIHSIYTITWKLERGILEKKAFSGEGRGKREGRVGVYVTKKWLIHIGSYQRDNKRLNLKKIKSKSNLFKLYSHMILCCLWSVFFPLSKYYFIYQSLLKLKCLALSERNVYMICWLTIKWSSTFSWSGH